MRILTQLTTLPRQCLQLLAPIQHLLNRLMQHHLRLIQLLLDLHQTIRILRVLVLGDVFLEFGEDDRVLGGEGAEGGDGVFGEEVVEDAGEELVGDHAGVFLVADDDAADAFGAGVAVHDVACHVMC